MSLTGRHAKISARGFGRAGVAVAEFGRLPGLASGLKPSQGAAGGPGFTFDLDYSLSAPLAAAWPGLPARETVYRLATPGFSEERVKSLAGGLGITAPVVREGFQDGFILTAAPMISASVRGPVCPARTGPWPWSGIGW